MTYIVIGLGNFGTELAERLTALGHEVVGVDKDFQKVEEMKTTISITLCLNLTDSRSLNLLPLKDAEIVFVAMGEDFGASILSVALLRQFGVKKLVARATTKLHKSVLEAMGVDQVVMPEIYAADLLSNAAEFPCIIGSYFVTQSFRFVESATPDILVRQKITNIDFSKTFGLQLLGIKRSVKQRNFLGSVSQNYEIINLLPDTIIEKDDILLLYGDLVALKKFWAEF